MDLNAGAWHAVLKGNGLFSGLVVQENQTISRAPRQAFVLDEKECDSPGVPSFELFDDSSVITTNVKSQLQKACLRYGIAWEDLETSLTKTNSATDTTPKESAPDEELCVTYNFPRVIVNLQPQHLKLSESCEKALRQIEETKEAEDVHKFYKNFGDYVSSSVYLGARLQCFQHANTVSGSTTAEKRETLRKAALAAFSNQRASSPLPGEEDAGLKSQFSSMSLAETTSLAWEIRGGDVLIGSHLGLWAPTIKFSQNWRLIQSKETMDLSYFIGKMDGWEHVPNLFDSILLSVRPEDWTESLFTVLQLLRRNKLLLDDVSDESTMDLLQQILDAGADVNLMNANGETPLFVAVKGTNVEVMRLLIKNGADISQKAEFGRTVLQAARTSPDMVKELVTQGADVNASCPMGSLLNEYAAYGPLMSLNFLIDGGASINETDSMGRTPLVRCLTQAQGFYMDRTDPDGVLKSLISHGADVSIPDKSGRTALAHVLDQKRLAMVKLLLESGASPNKTYTNHSRSPSPLHRAAMNNFAEAIPVLISFGADVEQLNWSRQSPLSAAVVNGNLESVGALLDAGASIKKKTSTSGSSGSIVQEALNLQHRPHMSEIILRLQKHVDSASSAWVGR